MPRPNKDSYEEGTSGIVTAGQDNYVDIDLAKGTQDQDLISCKLAIASASTATVQFFDATTATPLTGAVYYTAQPNNGFRLGRKVLTSGTLRVKIANLGGNSTAYYNVQYDYKR